MILNSKGNHFISQKTNYQASKYLGNEMNWDLLLRTGFLHGNSNFGFKQNWKRKINVCQWGGSRCWPLWHYRSEYGSVFFDFRVGLALCTGCHVSNKDLGPQRGGSVSFMALCRVTANAVFARWPVMDKEIIQHTSFLVPLVVLIRAGQSFKFAFYSHKIKHYLWNKVYKMDKKWVN